jgi:hypothetical protein
MRPNFTFNDERNGSLRYIKFARQLRLGIFARRISLPNAHNFIVGKFCHVVRLPLSHTIRASARPMPVTNSVSSFIAAIMVIISIAAQKEVGWVAAKAIIAGVADKVLIRVLSVMGKVKNAVGEPLATLGVNQPIPRMVDHSLPFPAFVGGGVLNSEKQIFNETGVACDLGQGFKVHGNVYYITNRPLVQGI